MMKKLFSLILVSFFTLSLHAQDSWKPFEGNYEGHIYLDGQTSPKETGKKNPSVLTLNDQGITLRVLKMNTLGFKDVTLSPIEFITAGENTYLKGNTWSREMETLDGRYLFSYASILVKEHESIMTGDAFVLPFQINLGNGRTLYGHFEGKKTVTGLAFPPAQKSNKPALYDLSGRPLKRNTGGLVIENGQKKWTK